jgi:hypothetical protein
MGDEPRNTASEVLRLGYPTLGDGDATTLSATLSDGFVREDRRRLIGLGVEDRETFVASSLALGDLGRGRPETSIVQVLAVRGEALVAAWGRSQYVDGTAIDVLMVVQFGVADWQLERIVLFDPDDERATLDELDRLHNETGESPG